MCRRRHTMIIWRSVNLTAPILTHDIKHVNYTCMYNISWHRLYLISHPPPRNRLYNIYAFIMWGSSILWHIRDAKSIIIGILYLINKIFLLGRYLYNIRYILGHTHERAHPHFLCSTSFSCLLSNTRDGKKVTDKILNLLTIIVISWSRRGLRDYRRTDYIIIYYT